MEKTTAAAASDSSAQLNETKQQQLRQFYEELDIDKDGRVDFKELAAALKKRMPKVSDTVEFAQQIMQKADMSSDAAIDFNEFASYMLEHEQKLALTFRDLDKNKDGVIDLDEVKRLFEELGLPRITDRQAKSIIAKMTSEGKNTIGLEEFQKYFILHPSARTEDIAKYWHRGLYIDIGEGAIIVPRGDAKAAWWKPLVVGGMAGAVSRSATAPLDRLKIFLQVHATRKNDLGVINSFRYLMKEGGIKALWRGNGVNVAKVVPDSAIKYWAYEELKSLIAGDRQATRLSVAERFCAGSVAGAFSQTLIYPLEVLKTRLALRKSGEMDSGMLQSLKTVYKREGFRAMFRGYVPTVMGIMPYAGTELAVYETLKNLCVDHFFEDRDPGLLVPLGCGVTSSMIAQLASYPLGLVRTRMQAGTQNQPDTMRGQFTSIVRQEGLRGLYRGLVPNFMKALPAAAVGYIVYEAVGKQMGLK